MSTSPVTQSNNNLFGGSLAPAQASIYSLIMALGPLSQMFIKLQAEENLVGVKSGQVSAENTEEASNERASQMRSQAIGSFALGGIEGLGIGAAVGNEIMGNRGLAGEQEELDSMKKYRDGVADETKPGKSRELLNFAEKDTADVKKTVNELKSTTNYTNRDFDKDMENLQFASPEQTQELVESLTGKINSAESSLANKLQEVGRRSQYITQGSNAIAQVANSGATVDSAHHQGEVGKYEAEDMMAKTSGQLAEKIGQTASSEGKQFFELELQEFQTLSTLKDSDTAQ